MTPESPSIAALASPRSRAIALAFIGAFQPTPLPLTGLHKFYLGQPGWGAIYLVLGLTPIARIACAAEGVWYLLEAAWEARAVPFPLRANAVGYAAPCLAEQTRTAAAAVRDLEALRQDGLLSEQEFEQQRRRVLASLE